MPNLAILNEKKAMVAELREKMTSACAGVLVDYSGISVSKDTELRRKLREASVDYSVVKNSIVRFAVDGTVLSELEPLLNGSTAIALSNDDPVAPAKLLSEYAAKLVGHFEIKGGFMDGRIISLDEINSLARIPALPVLQAQLLGTMLAPITSLAIVLKAIAEKNGDGETAEAAPTEEAPTEEAPAEASAAE